MTATDLTRLIPVEPGTAGATLGAFIDYLDGIRNDIGGYTLMVNGYSFKPGEHEISVVLFHKTPEQAQVTADTLGVTFHRSDVPKWRHTYDGLALGVKYSFQLSRNLEEYPETIAPVTGGHDE